MYRLAKKELLYRKSLEKNGGCYFCDPIANVIENYDNFFIMKNNFPYDIWDYIKVSKHLLLVSKKHFTNLDEFSKSLLVEYANIIQKYSRVGYDIFTRSSNSKIKTQPHFHTHLIKTAGKRVQEINYEAHPYKLVLRYR